MRTRSFSLLLALVAATSCTEGLTRPSDPPQFEILDAVHNSGNEHFFWLPPMITPMPAVSGVFDGTADPVVQICEGPVSNCATPVITVTLASGLTVNTVDEWYGTDWYVFDHDPAEGDVFRISVSVAGQELGFADLLIVDKVTGQVKNALGGDFILLSETNGRRFLKIRFRIEEGALATASGMLYAKVGGSIAVFDISDLQHTEMVHLELYTLAGSKGIAFDQRGNLYTGWGDGLDVYDGHLNVITHYILAEPPDPVHGLFLATRPGQVFACHPSRTPAALLLVFDIEDVTNPSLTNVVEIPGTGDLGGRECRGIGFDTDGRLWITAYQRLIRMTVDAEGNPQTWDFFSPGGVPYDVAFDPRSGRIFYTRVNENAVQILDPALPAQAQGTITDLCDSAVNSPGTLTFDTLGNLFVSCEGEPAIVAFPQAALEGVIGAHDAAALGMIRVDVLGLPSTAKGLAVSPIAASFP